MSALVEELASLSGLSPIFAMTVVKRALERSGIDPPSFQRKDIDKVLPELRRALTVYLGESEAQNRALFMRKGLGP